MIWEDEEGNLDFLQVIMIYLLNKIGSFDKTMQ